MFGTYRALLAFMVVFLHLGGMAMFGEYAVFGFYTLSGYLMTLIVTENYGLSLAGVGRYALNRVLRIYPIYWLACLLSLLVLLLVGEDYARDYNHSLYYPPDLTSVLRNLFLVFSSRDTPRLTPPSWALSVELVFYIAIGLGVARSRLTTGIWFVASIGYTVFVNVQDVAWWHRYFSIPAASLPFSLGAMIYHHRAACSGWVDRLGRPVAGEYLPAALYACVLANWAIGRFLHTERGGSFYINLLLCALVQISLLERRSLPVVSPTLDRALGDLSYPVYLIHHQVGLLLLFALGRLGHSIRAPSLPLAFVCVPLLVVIAWLTARWIEAPIEVLRSRVKGRSGRR